MPSFYVVLPAPPGTGHDTEFMKAEGTRYGAAPVCDVCGKPLASRAWLPPYRIELELRGEQWGDFAFFGSGELVLSEAAASIIRQSGLTGLSGLEPLEVVAIRGEGPTPPAYVRAEVARPRTFFDPARSTIVSSDEDLEEEEEGGTCPGCRIRPVDAIGGFTVDSRTWAGHDLFSCRNLPGVIVGSQAFTETVEAASLTNIFCIPTESYVWDPTGLLTRTP
jgi:hypothetical protein